jgi:outer membrane protein TolC
MKINSFILFYLRITNSMRRIKRYSYFYITLFLTQPAFAFYPIGVEQIISSVIKSSKEVESFKKVLLADDDLVESEKKYFYPKVNVRAEYTDYYDYSGNTPSINDKDFSVTLELLIEIYSDTTKNKISSAESNRLSSGYKLKEKINEIYFSIAESLINIERSRVFLKNSKLIEIQLKDYIKRVSQSVNEGISPKSYLKETELVKVRFDNVITTVESNVDRYFKDLSLNTGYKIEDKSIIGINSDFLKGILQKERTFNPHLATQSNFGLLAKYHKVEGLKHSAESLNEKMKLTLFNSTDTGLIATETNFNHGLRNTSVVGIRFEYQLYDVQKNKTKSSGYNTYLSQLAMFDNDKEKIYLQVLQLQDSYYTLVKKRKNLLEQARLSKNLIETQEREIFLGRIDFIDIVKSLPELIRTDVTLLDNDMELYNTIAKYKHLVSTRFHGENL